MSDYVPNDGIEDADENDAFESLSGRQGLIYLIDAGKYVNSPDKSIVQNDEQFRLCLDCIEADLLKSILVNPKCLVSIVFYNTVHSPRPNALFMDDDGVNTLVPANCALFLPLKPISKDLIRNFKNFKDSPDLFDFDTTYGSSDGSSFSEALWLCSRLIIQSNYKLVASEIVLSTNNELPHPNSSKEQRQAFERAKDLRENNITIFMLPMLDVFDFEPFYKEFLSVVYNLEEDDLHFDNEFPKNQRFQLLNRQQRANYQKSCLRHLNFELTDGVAMACDVYSLSRNAKKPGTVKMFRSTNEVVVGKRCHYVEEQNQNVDEQNPDDEIEIVQRKVLPAELCKSQVVCGKEVVLRPEDVIKMKSILSPGLRLLGFKPLNELQPRWMIKHCLFLYPNEKKTTGSTVLFRTLWEKCMEKQKYALCTLTMRRATFPKYVALVGAHTEDDSGNIYDGFYVIHLPMESNISVLDSVVTPLTPPAPTQVELLEKLCKKFRFKYQPKLFANPMLASFYSNLEALVYDEEAVEVDDVTVPRYENHDAKIQEFIDAIAEEFETDPTGSASKRANTGDAGGRPKASKKDLSPNDIEQAIRNGRIEAVTVQHLKDFLRSNKTHAPSSATKIVLFDLASKLVN